MRAVHVSASLHTPAYGWCCSFEGGRVGKAAKTNEKNRKRFSWAFRLLLFPLSIGLVSVGSCQGWFAEYCDFSGLILAFVVPEQMDKKKKVKLSTVALVMV